MNDLFHLEIFSCPSCGDYLTIKKSARCVRCGKVTGTSRGAIIEKQELDKIRLKTGYPDFLVLEHSIHNI